MNGATSLVAVREERLAELGRALVEDHHRTELAEDTPRCSSPEGRDASLLDQHRVGLFHCAELGPLDVALHARLEGVRRVAQHAAQGATEQGGGEAGRVLRPADAVREALLDHASQDRHQAQETTTVDALTQADAEGSSHDRRGPAGDQVRRRGAEGAALALLLDHRELDGAADEAGEVAGAEGSSDLLTLRQRAVLPSHDKLLDHAGARELQHDATRVV
mmetsp:Transcript_14653/g.51480  ORF Transcript_14653/g.51480 Transcript_14653/m.51480 type:complete len:220 (-) Transcript_14653:291-950(-)